MKRDSSDIQWRKVKEKVKDRDKGRCRLMSILSLSEAFMLKRNAGSFLDRIDAAHYRSVSERPDLIYDSNNIVCLNRYSHSNLDDFKDPIDGHSISEDDVERWWRRILSHNKSQYSYLMENGLLREKNDGISDN